MSGGVDGVRLRQEWLGEVLGLQQKRWPSFSTYTYALSNWQTYESVEKGQGRLERRKVTTSCQMRDWFAGKSGGYRAGLPCRTHDASRWQNHPRGRLWHHQPLSRASRCQAACHADPCSLVH